MSAIEKMTARDTDRLRRAADSFRVAATGSVYLTVEGEDGRAVLLRLADHDPVDDAFVYGYERPDVCVDVRDPGWRKQVSEMFKDITGRDPLARAPRPRFAKGDEVTTPEGPGTIVMVSKRSYHQPLYYVETDHGTFGFRESEIRTVS